jgi:hypothetical protein
MALFVSRGILLRPVKEAAVEKNNGAWRGLKGHTSLGRVLEAGNFGVHVGRAEACLRVSPYFHLVLGGLAMAPWEAPKATVVLGGFIKAYPDTLDR